MFLNGEQHYSTALAHVAVAGHHAHLTRDAHRGEICTSLAKDVSQWGTTLLHSPCPRRRSRPPRSPDQGRTQGRDMHFFSKRCFSMGNNTTPQPLPTSP